MLTSNRNGTYERKTFETLYQRAVASQLLNLADFAAHINLSSDMIENYLSKWFYREQRISFEVLIDLDEEQIQETYQLTREVYADDFDLSGDFIAQSITQEPTIHALIDSTLPARENEIKVSEEEKSEGSPKQFDASFLWSLIDPRPSLIPMTIRRAIWWVVLLVSLGGITYGAIKKNIFEGLQEWANANNIPVMVVLNIYEPLKFAIEMFATEKYPDEVAPTTCKDFDQLLANPTRSPKKPLSSITTSPNPQLAIIIPCHNSAKHIKKTIEAALRHVSPEQIFIMDNGLTDAPTDNTKDVVDSIHPDIKYFWLPNTGNKTMALLMGAEYVKKKCLDLTLAMIIDDDTWMPREWSIKHKLFEYTCVEGVVYPLRAESLYKEPPLVCRWQDLEYKTTDLELAYLDESDGVYRPHGAASLWKIGGLVRVLKKHNAVFKGEDLMMGLIAKSLDNEDGGFKLRLDRECYFGTTVPQTYIGESPNLYQQRVRSWNEAMFLYPWNLLFKPLLKLNKGSPTSLLKIKNSQLYNLYTQLNYLLRYPFIALVCKNPQFWLVFGIFKTIDTILNVLFNYVKLPSHLRSDLLTTLTFPLYKETISLMGTLSALRVLFVSGSAEPHPRSLNHQIGHGRVNLADEDRKPKPNGATLIASHRSNQRTASFDAIIELSEQITEGDIKSFLSDSGPQMDIKGLTINPTNIYVPRQAVIKDNPSKSGDSPKEKEFRHSPSTAAYSQQTFFERRSGESNESFESPNEHLDFIQPRQAPESNTYSLSIV
jgi:glycosyltransferase involved in cell wall biosynthesis